MVGLEEKLLRVQRAEWGEMLQKGSIKPIKVVKPSYENFCQAHDQEKVVLNAQILYPLQTAVISQFQKMKQLERENILAVIHFIKEVWQHLFSILAKFYKVAPSVNVFLYFLIFLLAPVTHLIIEKVNINELEINYFLQTLTLGNKSKHLTE